MVKRKAVRKTQSDEAVKEITITLQTSRGAVCKIKSGPKLQQQAMRWSYIVRQRHRWSQQKEASDEIESKAERALHELGINTAHLKQLAAAEVIEVSIPYQTEGTAWEARVFPWEFMLSAATKQHATTTRPLVTRQIVCKPAQKAAAIPQQLMIAVCAPGALGEQYTFDGEVQLVKSTLNQFEVPTIVNNPSREELTQAFDAVNTPVIHIAGVDAHQGAVLLNQDESVVTDGLYLNERRKPTAVNAQAVAAILNSGQNKPALVCFNVWDSGARLAPLTVALGANAAIGFEHTVDDSVAELFFANFYRTWAENAFDLLGAFREGMKSIASYGDRIRGTSIVLCSSRSLVVQSTKQPLPTPTSITSFRAADPALDKIEELVRVEVVPNDPLNYALLHNRHSLMANLKLWFVGLPPVDVVRGIDVFVQLNVGSDSFPYRTQLNLSRNGASVDLANTGLQPRLPDHPRGGIHVPLTSTLARSVDEAIQTSIFVDVTWCNQVIYRHTHTVRLAPVDEWRFTDQDIIWLPSFIQPRDPAVQAIIASAQRYLMCLVDFTGAGFDGYQSFDDSTSSKPEIASRGIDLQVRSIWAALIQEYRLNYINPPPSYSENAQRLRTPRQVLQQGRGTCIDLAVLLASCLEWIEVYPVIFMLQDHAFPGYWRSEQAYQKFRQMDELDGGPLADQRRPGNSRSTEFPWFSDRAVYEELRGYLQRGELVPIETVRLTSGASFADATAEAVGYFDLKRNRNFHSMVDIVLSREKQVTPLPLCNDAFSDRHSREA